MRLLIKSSLLPLLLLTLLLLRISAEFCPHRCVCKKSGHFGSLEQDLLKVRCGDEEKLQVIVDDDFLNFANEVVQLNLSDNALSTFMPNVSFPMLQKLDLSKNQLTVLSVKMFVDMADLKRLDLSQNKLAKIDVNAFSGLKLLDRLKLNENKLVTIEKGTFEPIKKLKQLDISGNPLNCDCSLLWLLDWANKKVVKLLSNPKCHSPKEYASKPLRKIKVGDEIHCKSPAKTHNMPVVTLTPDHSQVVFEGDSFILHCRARSIAERYDSEIEPRDRVEWLWLDSNPRHYFSDINVANRYFADDGVIDSTLQIQHLHRNHSGIWNCKLISQQHGNHSTGITVVVISDETKYCPITTTSNNKGTYTWPRTVVNYTVSLQCNVQTSSDVLEQSATYFCSPRGTWENFNTSRCTYTSETTRILEQFAGANLFTLAKAQILESAKVFKNTSDIKIMKNVMDLVYAAETIENYLNFLLLAPDLGELLLDIINSFMEFDGNFLKKADNEDESCRKLVDGVERITNVSNLLPQQLHKSHIIAEKFPVRRDTFAGMTCTWYVDGVNVGKLERIFHCATSNVTSPVAQNKEVEGSIEVPSNLFYQLQENDVVITNGNLLVVMFNDGKLFPLGGEEENGNRVVSIIVGVKLDNLMVNLSHPIYIMLKPNIESSDLTSPAPVWFNPRTKTWSSEGCQLRHVLNDGIVFSCNHLGYYGLLQDVSHVKNSLESGAKFKFSHPAIYVGSFILFVCLLFCTLTYLFSYSAIQMPKKTKHSIINTWLSVMLLSFIYVFGIYQTEDVQLCQVIGLILHYLSLSSMLWMCVGVNSMYKRLRKSIATDSIELQDDELPSGEEPVQKPILGLYLVGWGVALIVCGISGAVNMKEYSAHAHCFLSTAPALSALYIPFFILLTFLVILFLLIRCAAYGSDSNGHLSEGTQATENVDLDLLEPNFPETIARSISVSTKTASSEVEDLEHAPMAQLKAYVIFLVLYILAWIACAVATVINKLPFRIPYEEDILSIIYALFASLLGLFSIFFYCVARNDVRNEWVLMGRLLRGKGKWSRNVSDVQARQITQIQQPTTIPLEQHNVLVSRSTSRSSNTKSFNSNALKAAALDLNSSNAHNVNDNKINNVNLVVLHRHQYRNSGLPNLIENPTHSAEMFYNPHQSTVARKFFKKQKRNMMKRNNLRSRPPPAAHSEASSMLSRRNNEDSCNILYANNAKVNNTNIHVERTALNKRVKNLNICDEDDHQNVIMHKNKSRTCGRIKKKHNACAALTNIGNNANMSISTNMSIGTNMSNSTNMSNNVAAAKPSHNNITSVRSVSQQCTLEYSSEPISDSILDLKSPDEDCKPSVAQVDTTILTESSGLQAPPNSTRRDNSPNTDRFYAALPLSSATPSPAARIYVNPRHEDDEYSKRAQSRASSVSASEIDELYQQIKRGPHRNNANKAYFNNMSDSEVRSYTKSIEKDETTV